MTDVLVRGRPNVLQVAGNVGGTKIMEVRRLAAQGHAVTVIGDKQFWKLVDTPAPARKNGGAAKKRVSQKSKPRSRQLVH